MSTKSSPRTAVAAPIQSRIGQAFSIKYAEVMPARKTKPAPVTIIPSQYGEGVHIGARNRRHRAKIELKNYHRAICA